MRFEPVTFTAKDGREVTMRHAEPSDAVEMLRYLKTTCGETPYLLREPEEADIYTLESEEDFLRTNMEDPDSLMLIAVVGGEIAGCCSFSPAVKAIRTAHRSSMGIALYKAYTGIGIGEKLLRTAMEKAKECGYESMEMDVVSTNEPAIRLYEKLGFEVYGSRPYSMKYKDGSYATDLQMIVRL